VRSELESVKNALKVNDFDLAAEAADRASRAAQELQSLGEHQRQLDEGFHNPPQIRSRSEKLAERLARDAQRVESVNEKLSQLFPPPGSMMSEDDRARLKKLAGEQRQLEKRAQSLQQQMEAMDQMAPVFGDEASSQLNQISERMGAASERMDAQDPARGYGEQKAAQDLLQQFQKQMSENRGKGKGGKGLPLPMFAGGKGNGWGRNSSQEKVEIPDADQHQTPKEFRQDLMEAMKQGAPEKYRDQVKRYYEELVK
ncbi:MAG TPA: DUF4175 domain-containing protein, partial [Myxococcaceae bacterium]|nr:DUF4175 domain-containing protein [Myxococcaceae bacterium]